MYYTRCASFRHAAILNARSNRLAKTYYQALHNILLPPIIQTASVPWAPQTTVLRTFGCCNRNPLNLPSAILRPTLWHLEMLHASLNSPVRGNMTHNDPSQSRCWISSKPVCLAIPVILHGVRLKAVPSHLPADACKWACGGGGAQASALDDSKVIPISNDVSYIPL